MKYLGIDIGGTNIKAVVLERGISKPLEEFVWKSPHEKTAFLALLGQEVQNIVDSYEIAGIGVGVPGVFDAEKKVLIKAPNLKFLDNWAVGEFFSQFMPPTTIENDGRLFVRAEVMWGAGKGFQHVIGVAIGTGIGGGILLHGQFYEGAHNAAGEFGHMLISSNIAGEPLEWEKLAGKKAYEGLGDRSEIIGRGVANLINAFDPDIVLLGGGGITGGALNVPIIKKTAAKYILAPAAKKTPIIRGKLGYLAAAMGATVPFQIQELPS